jgi:hypothetical protein
MRRTIVACAIALALIAGITRPCGADTPVRIVIDGRPVLRTTALAHDGLVYVELGGFVRAFSGLVIFEKTAATVSIGNRVAVFSIGSSSANVDGRRVAIGGKAFEINGDFYVPLRFIATRVAHARVRIGSSGSLAMISSMAPPPPTATPDPDGT